MEQLSEARAGFAMVSSPLMKLIHSFKTSSLVYECQDCDNSMIFLLISMIYLLFEIGDEHK